ncbi:hypothetical protein CSKR_105840 [Clonorchis sinensis]|uniref:Uncharacterized protein n=1 Tax=Clonorchis sinensis TaxID=79923 RepID=A0A419PIB3_CLOSI|nr:hypothetical protein CSKR_105840 [Clonorchis sinensis]
MLEMFCGFVCEGFELRFFQMNRCSTPSSCTETSITVIIIVITIIIDSMTSVFNTDSSLPYNHDLCEGLIVKKRIKKVTTGTPLTWVGSHILQCLKPGAVGITRSPSWKASSTDSTKAFRDFLHTRLPGQGWTTSLLPPLWAYFRARTLKAAR